MRHDRMATQRHERIAARRGQQIGDRYGHVMWEPPAEPDWDDVIDNVLPHLGLWTGLGTYERAVAFLQGFDFARGRRMHPLMQRWAEEHYGVTNIGWPSSLVYLATGRPTAAELWPERASELSVAEDQAARELLQQALDDIRSEL